MNSYLENSAIEEQQLATIDQADHEQADMKEQIACSDQLTLENSTSEEQQLSKVIEPNTLVKSFSGIAIQKISNIIEITVDAADREQAGMRELIVCRNEFTQAIGAVLNDVSYAGPVDVQVHNPNVVGDKRFAKYRRFYKSAIGSPAPESVYIVRPKSPLPVANVADSSAK